MPDEPIVAEHWLPPSPHREAVLEYLRDGRAHLVERGHRVPPLLVFEDGGAIELPRVRYQMTRRGMALVAAEGDVPPDQTRFYDVCGCVDEFKGRLKEREALDAGERADLGRLLEDACRMIQRMERRRERYERFAQRLAELAAELQKKIEARRWATLDEALAQVEEIKALLAANERIDEALRERLDLLAEGVRAVADALEGVLSAGKETALAALAEYEEIRGGRAWQLPPKEATNRA